MQILFSGMLAGDPFQGGATWAILQYLLGLKRLGHRVLLVEPLQPAQLQPQGSRLEASDNARYFDQVVRQFDLLDQAALLLAGTQTSYGVSYPQLADFARRADLLFNVSGMLTDPQLLEPIPRRAYLDLDPAFVQLWHQQGIDMRFEAHTHFITVGTALGTPACPIPTCGRDWIPTLQPVVLGEWPMTPTVRHDALTTIANWRGYGSVEFRGQFYGQKAHSLRPFFDLPSRTTETFLLALAIHPGETPDLEALARFGWQRCDPRDVVGSPDSYRRFIQGSKAEFGIAKSGYVLSRCGWFSDRSACYLASGRPVLAQDTGFSQVLPTGRGLLPFCTADDLLAGIESINADYEAHRQAARAIAERYFDSDRVLPAILDRVG